MGFKTIRLAPDMLELVKSGRKTMTSKPKRYDGTYEIVRGSWFRPERLGICVEVTLVVDCKLGVNLIAVKYYKQEGFDSPQAFLTRLGEMYKRGVPLELYLHWVRVVKC